MSLTKEQQEQRQMGVGASEVAALAGISRFSDSVKVWATKRRGPDGEIPPMVPPEEETEGVEAADIGNALEPALADLYLRGQPEGTMVLPCHTLVHAAFAQIMATPDRLVYSDEKEASAGSAEHGLELKVVGRYMADDWSDGVPDYVVCQCQQNMNVTGLDRWDVAALIGGTNFQTFTVWRDDDVIEALTNIVMAFWVDHVEADIMPPIVDGKRAQKVLAAKWAIDDGNTIKASAEADELAVSLAAARQVASGAKKQVEALKAELCALVGDAKTIRGDAFTFSWPTMRGGVAWKKVAEELAGDDGIPEDVTERHRSKDYRKAGFYPRKAKK